MTDYYFKTGADFEFPMQLTDADTDEPVAISDQMQIASSVAVTVLGSRKLVAVCSVELMAQTGFFKLVVPAAITSGWPKGLGELDVKITIDGKIVISDTIPFDVDRSIS